MTDNICWNAPAKEASSQESFRCKIPNKQTNCTWSDVVTLTSREVINNVLHKYSVSPLYRVYSEGGCAGLLYLHSERILV